MTQLRLLCVHPHPDDESIACGGVLARYAAEGVQTHVVTCTGGEVGENLADIDLGGHDLPWHRRAEMAAAAQVLRLASHRWLGYLDSGMADTETNDHPDAFANADLYEASARLARHMRDIRPHVVVSDDEHGTYGHPDHLQAHRVTVRAAAMAADPWWDTGQQPWSVGKRYTHTISRDRMFRLHKLLTERGLASPFGTTSIDGPDDLPFGSPDAQITTRVGVGEWMDRKHAAMRAHRSQIGDDSFFFNLPDELLEEGFAVEEYVRVEGSGTSDEDDLFAGLR